MSGAFSKLGALRALPSKLPFKRPSLGRLNATGAAGPRRLIVFALAGTSLAGLVAVVAFSGRPPEFQSRDARMKEVDPLPGGLHSTPEQDALARKADSGRAQAALQRGVSFTPPMAPSQLVLPGPLQVDQPVLLASIPSHGEPVAVPAPRPAPPPLPAAMQAAFPVALPLAPAAPLPTELPPRPMKVAAPTADPAAQQAYTRAVQDLFQQWGGRAPRTDVILPPEREAPASDDVPSSRPSSAPSRVRDATSPLPVSSRSDAANILVPAGRMIYAHPVLQVSSDASSPVVLEADTGPIAGDRMIGSFGKQNDRLVIHINSVIHHGESIGAEGLVIAPDTMEAGVASGVDQHYLERFALPAAAAFVAGLGQAIAQTSNSVAVLSPLGGATTSTNLNIRRQLGVGAGAAAAQLGSVLNQSAPKGPTISLDANVAVGVMFLTNVTSHGTP